MAPAEEVVAEVQQEEEALDDNTMALQVQQFLDEWHYRVLQSGAAKTWSRSKVVNSALTVCQLNGVSLSDEEVDTLATMEEPDMLRAVVAKMPTGVRRNWEHFLLQFQLVVITTTRVLKAVEENREDELMSAMEDSETAGITQQILKSAIVQASTEAHKVRFCHNSWAKNAEKRIERLTKAAGEAELLQAQLSSVEDQLEQFGVSTKGNSKKVMQGLAAKKDKALVLQTFSAWSGYLIKWKSEKAIRDKFENQITECEMALMQYRQKQIDGVRNVIMRNAEEGNISCLNTAMVAWKADLDDAKKAKEVEAAMKAAEGKLQSVSQHSKNNTKKVMTRMTGDSTAALLALCWQSWRAWLEEYRKDKELEDQVKESEKRVQEFLKAKSEEARGVLDRMSSGSDSGLISMVFQYWVQAHNDEKKSRELEDAMNEKMMRFNGLNGRQKDSAYHMQQRINEQMNTNLVVRILAWWNLEAKHNKISSYHASKLESKRKQLTSVHQMFKGFAAQLDTGLGPDSDSARKKLGMKSDKDGGVQLPDIHAKPMAA